MDKTSVNWEKQFAVLAGASGGRQFAMPTGLRNSPCRQARKRSAFCSALKEMLLSRHSPTSLRNSPCRQARELRSLAVAAFAVCMQKNTGSCVSKLPPSQYSFACAWLIANAQKAGDTHPVRTPGLRDMSLLVKPRGFSTVIPNQEDGDRSLAVFLLMAVDQQVGQPSFVL